LRALCNVASLQELEAWRKMERFTAASEDMLDLRGGIHLVGLAVHECLPSPRLPLGQRLLVVLDVLFMSAS
jgi:hypothetical protein